MFIEWYKIVGVTDTRVDETTISPFMHPRVSYKKGVLNAEGERVIPLIYDEIIYDRSDHMTSSSEMVQCAPKNLFIVQEGSKQGVINMKNEIVIPIAYDGIQFLSGIVQLMRHTIELGPNGEYLNDTYEFGISDMIGRVLVPVEERNYGDSPADNWFQDEERGAER
jgi:hypothetical protein